MLSKTAIEFLEEFTSNNFQYDVLTDAELEKVKENLEILEVGTFVDEQSFYKIKNNAVRFLSAEKVEYKVDDMSSNKVYLFEAYEELINLFPNLSVLIDNHFKNSEEKLLAIHVIEGSVITFSLNSGEYTYDISTGKRVAKEEPEVVVAETADPFNLQGLLDETASEIASAGKENGGKVMKKVKVSIGEKIKAAVTGMEDAAKNVKVQFGQEKEGFVNSVDASINEIKNHMQPVLDVLDDAMGCSALKEEICEIIFNTTNGAKSQNSFFVMAKKCRAAVQERIEFLKAIDPDDKIGSVAKLRELTTEVRKEKAEDGSEVEVEVQVLYTQTIWSAFASALVLVCKKVARKIRKWFGVTADTNVFGVTGAAIANVFAKVGNVLKHAASIAGNIILYVGSYVVAGVLTVAAFVIKAIKWLFDKIKGWGKKKEEKATQEEVLDDIDDAEDIEEELEEELEEVFFEEE